MSLRTFYNASEHRLSDRLLPSALPVPVKLLQSAAFQLKSKDGVEFSKNVPENPKIKVARNGWGKVRTCSEPVRRCRKSVGK